MANMLAGVARTLWRAAPRAAGTAAAGMLVASSIAFGQAALEQYIPSTSPAGHHHAGRGSDADAPPTAGASGSAGDTSRKSNRAGAATRIPVSQAQSGTAGGGNAPWTDYPLTTFVFIVAAIFGIVLLAMAVPAVIRRWRSRTAS